MARALIVGCGCRGMGIGVALRDAGWAVRGTSRRAEGVEAIEAAGLEGVRADPDRLGTVLDHVGDVGVVIWLMGSASGEAVDVAAVNGDRLESLMIRLVDTPVRGVVYEAAGTAPSAALRRGRAIVEEAGARWRIPVAVLAAAPDDSGWCAAAARAAAGLIAGRSPRTGSCPSDRSP